MSYNLTEDRRVMWPVTINEPADGGKITRRKIDIEFRIDDIAKWEETGESVKDVLTRNIVGWSGLQNSKKEPVPFNDETLEQLLTDPYALPAIWNAYLNEVLAGAEAKN